MLQDVDVVQIPLVRKIILLFLPHLICYAQRLLISADLNGRSFSEMRKAYRMHKLSFLNLREPRGHLVGQHSGSEIRLTLGAALAPKDTVSVLIVTWKRCE